jgi:hypothetical protein
MSEVPWQKIDTGAYLLFVKGGRFFLKKRKEKRE